MTPGTSGGARVDAQGPGKGENGASEMHREIPGFIARVVAPGSLPDAAEQGGVLRDGEKLHVGDLACPGVVVGLEGHVG